MALAEQQASDAATRASGSSFYAAMRILPRAQRQAMFEIYSFCRAVDDIADDPGPREGRRERLRQWRNDIAALYAGSPPPHLRDLAAAVRQFGMRQEDFLAVVDGMEMDVAADIRAPDDRTLDLYCDRVASAVGRLSVKVFGMNEQDGFALAHHLGRALQLSNILRDLDEDAAIGRLYLSREVLAGAGIADTDPAAVIAHPAIGKACATIVARAREHFRQADIIMKRWPRAVVKAPRIMGEAYASILDALEARGFSPPREKVKLSKLYLLWVLARNAII
ncbi:MAG TPA: presqualene diphosphate synthase HpnD [Pseudorhodoplanes sp.]|jgi:phytoene synthase|nr:presqualene diphosphate synthase HpnD [Pseudorhodoplanes sp.]